MKRGPTPEPPHLKLLKGTGSRRKAPCGSQFTVSEHPPEPPEIINVVGGYALDEWYRLSGELHRAGLLDAGSVMVFAAYCISVHRFCEAVAEVAKDDPADGLTIKTATGAVMQHPLVSVARGAAQDLLKIAGELALTNVARARIASVLEQAPPSKFSGLLSPGTDDSA